MRFGGLTAVEDVDCAVDERQIFSIIGPNGAGKTTVFNAITGIYEPTGGSIEFRGRPLERPFTWQVLAVCALVGLAHRAGRRAGERRRQRPVAGHDQAQLRRTGRAVFLCAPPGATPGTTCKARWRSSRCAAAAGPCAPPTAAARSAMPHRRRSRADARSRFERLIAAAAHGRRRCTSATASGSCAIADDTELLATFDTEADAAARVGQVRRPSPANRPRGGAIALVALLLGIVVGAAGTWAVWSRARRTPEVIARAGIARTFQNIRLFQNMTVLDNVLIAMDRQLAAAACCAWPCSCPASAGRSARPASERASCSASSAWRARRRMLAKNLPYGDQRRLEIARALATEPQLILLDEPAAGMNPAESVELNGLIEQIRDRGLTVLLIEHHMKVVMGISDRIAVLDYGVKIAEGTPERSAQRSARHRGLPGQRGGDLMAALLDDARLPRRLRADRGAQGHLARGATPARSWR